MLEADDYDTPANGKPFTFEIPFNASDKIRNKFRIDGKLNLPDNSVKSSFVLPYHCAGRRLIIFRLAPGVSSSSLGVLNSPKRGDAFSFLFPSLVNSDPFSMVVI